MMRMDEHPSLQALDEIEDLLEAYAEARLSPSSPILARMRRAVLAEAASVAATRAAERRAAERAEAPRRPLSWLPRLLVPRPVFGAGFAVALTLGIGSAVLAAPPGSPFYNARVALEAAFLPVEIDARLAAHEEHLDARLAEAEAAAARGDAPALSAALAAYDAEVAAALAEVGSDADLLAHLEAMLAKHVDVLTALEAKVPEQASVDKAIENSQKAIGKIKERNGRGRPSDPPGGQREEAPGRP